MSEKDQSEQVEPVESSRRFSPWFWVCIAALPVLYVLSTGPVALYVDKHESSEKFFNVIYAPLIWLAENTALGEPIEWYVRLWVDDKVVP